MYVDVFQYLPKVRSIYVEINCDSLDMSHGGVGCQFFCGICLLEKFQTGTLTT